MACFLGMSRMPVNRERTSSRVLRFSTGTLKVTKANFSVRCGVNAGLVYFRRHDPARDDLRSPSSTLRGHMQKHAEPKYRCLSRERSSSRCGNWMNSRIPRKVVDGYEASVSGATPVEARPAELRREPVEHLFAPKITMFCARHDQRVQPF